MRVFAVDFYECTDDLAWVLFDLTKRAFKLVDLGVDNLTQMLDLSFRCKQAFLICQISYVEQDALSVIIDDFVSLKANVPVLVR